MTTLEINSISPIINECCDNRYEGIAFDGCYFYITMSNCPQVDKFDSCFCNKDSIKTCREYTSICYDCELKCFWALSNCSPSYIYKLDKCLKEIDYIYVEPIGDCPICITSVSCSCNKGKLLISTLNCIAEISKCNCPEVCILKKCSQTIELISVQGMCNVYLTAYSKCQSMVVSAHSYNNTPLIKCYLPDDYKIKDIVVLDKCSKLQCTEVYILTSKHCSYPYILKCILRQNDDGCNCYNFCESQDLCQDIENFIPDFINCIPNFNMCCEPVCCKKSINLIIESIALIEAALSHILNAEGEKIQKILECANDANEIIKVNEAVNNVVINITHLEHVLYNKLQTVKSMLPKSCKEECKKSCCKPCKEECKEKPSKPRKEECKKTPTKTCKDKCKTSCLDAT